jgi:hypothetical protein
MRILIAGVLGGLVMFVWGAVAHMALPIGEAGMKVPESQAMVLEALASSTAGEGVYMYPSISPEQYADGAALEEFRAFSRERPFAWVVWQPAGNPGLQDMAVNLAKQCISCLLAAFALAWILSLAPWSFGRRVLVAGVAALFAWLTLSVPYWNWYLFPTSFTVGALAEQVIGWLLAGAAIAWWLGRAERATR